MRGGYQCTLVAGWVLLACLADAVLAQSPPANDERVAPHRLETAYLPNAVQLHPLVISGGLPEGDSAFAELNSLGVRTIISVDGAKPDVDAAKRHGLRYVHMPHGYDGISDLRAKELAKALVTLEGPFYIHCHHGKHRSPAAASVACVGAGLLQPQMALTVLKVAGTNPNYRGLYRATSTARKFERSLLDELAAPFPEVAQLPPMAEAMVAIEQTFDHLEKLSAHEWQSLPNYPDLDASHEALLLREHYTELLRTPETKSQPNAFVKLLQASESLAQKLEDQLRSLPATDGADREQLQRTIDSTLSAIHQQCKTCHQTYRDVPLNEQ